MNLRGRVYNSTPLRAWRRFIDCGLYSDIASIRHSPRHVAGALIVLAAVPLAAAAAAGAVFYLAPLPAVVPDPQPGALAQTSRVYAADGSVIATFHSEHNRELVKLSEIPQHVQNAVLAAEDARFYRHSGIDVQAVLRAILADIRAGATVQGGSTITQQYVKNAYLKNPQRTIFRKVREALVAGQLERIFTKKKILNDYLNTVYMGKGAYGMQAAAKTFFDKPVSQVTVSEGALLAGVIRSPINYSPYDNPDVAEKRRRYVLGRMLDLGFITHPVAIEALSQKPQLTAPKQEILRYPWFVDALLRNLIADPDYGEAKVFNGGLNIHTTIDPRMQETAERVVAETLPNPADPHAALVSVEPRTGYVKSVVGGRAYGHETEKYNLAVQARRSPGSSFKTFVLAAALRDGVSPATRFRAPGVLKVKGWGNKCQCVSNFGGNGYGSMSMQQATVKSVNTVYVQIAQRVGFSKINDVARAMGISERSLGPEEKEKNLAISIGGFKYGVTPLEMASAYATLAAGGVYREPRFYSKIVDNAGKVLEQGPSGPVQALEPQVASAVTDVLKEVIARGTAQKADIGRPAAGKTGTSQSFTNAWFVGYTPDLSTSVWMGHRKGDVPMSLVRGVRNVTGGSIPAQIWSKYMTVALEGVPPSEFAEPGSSALGGLALPPRTTPTPTASPTPSLSTDPLAPFGWVGSTPTPSPSPVQTQTPDSSGGLLGGLFGGEYTPSPSPSPVPSPTPTPTG